MPDRIRDVRRRTEVRTDTSGDDDDHGTRRQRIEHHGEIVVIGLGRFGSSLAETLSKMGYEVLGIDADPDLVQQHAEMLTHVVTADSTNYRAMDRLGIGEARTAVVCIGTDIEASLLTTMVLKDLEIPNIWAKAISHEHGRLLAGLDIADVVFPEADMGRRVAHMVTGRTKEYLELDDNFVIAEMDAPAGLVGVPLADSNLRAKHKITVVCVKPAGSPFTYAGRDTVLAATDLIVIAGHRVDVDRFTAEHR
ncbi:MAG: potassium channel family protein [Ilumatobacteraceae bacterium]